MNAPQQNDEFNLDCSSMRSLGDSDLRLRGLMNEQRERIGLPPIPIYPPHVDNGQRLRRTDKVSANVNEPAPRQHSHYFKDVSKLQDVDVYRVCQLFGVDDPSGATQHAIKKLLVSGKRGVKDSERDIREAIDTLNRRLQMIAEDCN